MYAAGYLEGALTARSVQTDTQLCCSYMWKQNERSHTKCWTPGFWGRINHPSLRPNAQPPTQLQPKPWLLAQGRVGMSPETWISKTLIVTLSCSPRKSIDTTIRGSSLEAIRFRAHQNCVWSSRFSHQASRFHWLYLPPAGQHKKKIFMACLTIDWTLGSSKYIISGIRTEVQVAQRAWVMPLHNRQTV